MVILRCRLNGRRPAQKRRGAFETAGEEILVGRLAERTAELAAEMCGREVRSSRQRGYVERLAITGVGKVLRAEQVPGRMDGRHRLEYRRSRAAGVGGKVEQSRGDSARGLVFPRHKLA
jgi:hypothetical protein